MSPGFIGPGIRDHGARPLTQTYSEAQRGEVIAQGLTVDLTLDSVISNGGLPAPQPVLPWLHIVPLCQFSFFKKADPLPFSVCLMPART